MLVLLRKEYISEVVEMVLVRPIRADTSQALSLQNPSERRAAIRFQGGQGLRSGSGRGRPCTQCPLRYAFFWYRRAVLNGSSSYPALRLTFVSIRPNILANGFALPACWQNHLALPHHRDIGRGRHGRRLQAEGVKLDMHLRQSKGWRVMRVLD